MGKVSCFEKNTKQILSGLYLETYTSNLKSVALTALELLAFNGQKFRGHVTLATPPFREIFKGSCPACPWKHEVHIALTVLELLANLTPAAHRYTHTHTDTRRTKTVRGAVKKF